MQKQKFRPGDRCRIVKLGEASPYFEVGENFVGRRVMFVRYSTSQFVEGDFIACTLLLLENICINRTTQEYLLSGYEFYFPSIKLVKLKKATP